MPVFSPKVLIPVVVQLAAAVANLILSQGFTKVVAAQVVTLVASAVVGYFAPAKPAAKRRRSR